MRWAVPILALIFCAWGMTARAAEPAAGRVCFTAAQTREKIAAAKLAEPFLVMRGAASRFQAEALGVRLCRWGEEFVYEISLLRRDGHVIHAFMNAANGQVMGSKNAH